MKASCTALTIGNFDGCHIGHAALVEHARTLVGRQGRVIAMMFYPHPATVVEGGAPRGLIMSRERRAATLRGLGADEVVPLMPDASLLAMSPEQFVDRVVMPYSPAHIVEGENFRFGAGRAGDMETLRRLGASRGFEAHSVGMAEAVMSDQQVAPSSSTLARWLIARGRVEDAARVLGRPYTIDGVVERGDRRGRGIGFPTANVRTDGMLPREGIYAGAAKLSDGRSFAAAIHVGARPTFDDPRPTLEAYLLDWDGPIAEGRDEYGWEIALEVKRWVRDQLKFAGVEPLVAQIKRDVASVREMIEASTSAVSGVRC